MHIELPLLKKRVRNKVPMNSMINFDRLNLSICPHDILDSILRSGNLSFVCVFFLLPKGLKGGKLIVDYLELLSEFLDATELLLLGSVLSFSFFFGEGGLSKAKGKYIKLFILILYFQLLL